MFAIHCKHLQCITIGFAKMKGDFWVRVYLVHLVLLVAVPVRSVTVCRVRTEPSSTCDAACVRACVRRLCVRRLCLRHIGGGAHEVRQRRTVRKCVQRKRGAQKRTIQRALFVRCGSPCMCLLWLEMSNFIYS